MDGLDRYQRQMLLPDVGEAGQRRLLDARVLLVGCGALGSVIADALARAGVGSLTLVDRDVVEWTNLHRQVLYSEADARELMPKAEAARRALARINSGVRVDAHVADFTAANATQLADGCDVIVDGTDNFPTRLLLNDLAVERGVPFVYGGAVGTAGTLMTVLPRTDSGDAAWERDGHAGPCLRCLLGQTPSHAGPTCDTIGVLGPLAGVVASHQAIEAIKVLLGRFDRIERRMRSIDAWANTYLAASVAAARDPQCPCCGVRRFDYLHAADDQAAVTLCGRDAVQITAPAGSQTDLTALADRLAPLGEVTATPFLVRARLPFQGRTIRLSVFADGRAIAHGVDDAAAARAACARFLGR